MSPTNTPAETAAERQARHLRQSRRIIELGMTLARAAALRAEQDLAVQTDAPRGGPDMLARQARGLAAEDAFLRLAHVVREAITLEHRIAAHAAGAVTPAQKAFAGRIKRSPAARPATAGRAETSVAVTEPRKELSFYLADISRLPDVVVAIRKHLTTEMRQDVRAGRFVGANLASGGGRCETSKQPGSPGIARPPRDLS